MSWSAGLSNLPNIYFKTKPVPHFSKDESNEMYAILEEIHDALSDKRSNKGGILKMTPYELGWLLGIGIFMKKVEGKGK